MTGPVQARVTSRRARRGVAAAVAVAALGAGAVAGATTAGAAPAEVQASYGRHLLVADPAAQRLYAYRVSDMARTGQLDGIELAAHAGTVVLPDGRVLLVDDAHAQVVVLVVDGRGRPVVQRRIDIPGRRPWEGALWATVDPGANYLAVTSGYEDSAEQTVTVVDLFDHRVGQLDVRLDPAAGGGVDELHVWLAGQPLQVAVSTGGQIRSFPLDAVMTGQRRPAQTSAAPVGAGVHGPVLSRDGDRLLVTTPEGVDRLRIDGGRLTAPRSVPYAPGLPLVQDYRPRLSQDGRTLYGPAAQDQRLAPEQWAQTWNKLHTVDLRTETTATRPLAPGIVGRSAQSTRSALFPVIGGEQDSAVFVDVQAGSRAFGTVVQRVPLAPLTAGPRPGTSSAGTERRSAAITTAGDRGFVSHGGDGLISVVDPARATVLRTVPVPTPLTGGGYLVSVERGRPLVDVMAR